MLDCIWIDDWRKARDKSRYGGNMGHFIGPIGLKGLVKVESDV